MLNMNRFETGYELGEGCLAYDLMQRTFDIGEWIENTANEIKNAQGRPVRRARGGAVPKEVNSRVLARAILGLG